MSFNKIKTNRKRKGSISVVLIIMLFGSLLLAVNMETVQTAKNIERVELADVITYESGGGGPSHNFGDATWMDGYWQYADGTVVYRNIQQEWDWMSGNWIDRYILNVYGSEYAARQMYLSNGDIAWYFTVYDASYPDGYYILSPSYDGSFYLKRIPFSRYDEYGNYQYGYYEWNPVDNTVTYSNSGPFSPNSYTTGYKNESWIKNTETGDITFSAYTHTDVNGIPSCSKLESLTRNAETGEYEYTVTNTTYESREVTVPGHYEQRWRPKYIFHEDPLSGDIKINDDTGEPILDGNGNYIYGWREYLYDETGMPIEEPYDVWIDEYSYTDHIPVEETTTATYPVGELPPDVTNPFDGVDIGNGAFPATPSIPPDCTDLPWNF